MKRYKAGKAGFTDKAHLKAKGMMYLEQTERKERATNTNENN